MEINNFKVVFGVLVLGCGVKDFSESVIVKFLRVFFRVELVERIGVFGLRRFVIAGF